MDRVTKTPEEKTEATKIQTLESRSELYKPTRPKPNKLKPIIKSII